MSDFFADKQYQSLDWISQAVEPWDWSAIPAFNAFPQRTEITPSILQAVIYANPSKFGRYSIEFSVEHLVAVIAQLHDNPLVKEADIMPSHMRYSVYSLFELEYSSPYDTEFRCDDLSFSHPIYLVKTKPLIDDKICQEMVATNATEIFYDLNSRADEAIKRMGEILDLITSNKLARGRLNRRDQFIRELRTIFLEDKWRIRSVPLGLNIARWVVDYVNEGNLAAMANFAKVKVMTHAGKAIYSIQEVE